MTRFSSPSGIEQTPAVGSTVRPMAISAMQLFAGQVTTTVLGVLMNGMIGHALGPQDFGVWYLLSTILGLAYVFIDWGYSQYVIGEVSRAPARAGELTATVLTMRAVTATVAIAPAVILTQVSGYGARVGTLTALVMVVWLPGLLLSSFSWTLRGRERMDLEAVLTVIAKMLTLACTVAWTWSRRDLTGLIGAHALAGSCAFVVGLVVYRRLELPRLQPSLTTARELARRAAPIFTMGLMVSVQPYIDANMLARLAPPAAMGWYGAAATLAGTLIAPAVILGGTVYPRLARTAHDRQEFTQLVRAALRPMLFVAVLGSIGTYLFADFAIHTVYRDRQFGPAGAILQVFSPSLLLLSIDIVLGNVILASGRIALFARAKLGAVVITAILEFILIPVCQTQFGNAGVGVMLAFMGGELALVGAALWLVPRGTLTLRSLFDLGRALLAGAVTVVLVLPFAGRAPIAAIAVVIIVYTVLAFAFGLLTRNDVADLLSAIRSKKRHIRVAAATVTPSA